MTIQFHGSVSEPSVTAPRMEQKVNEAKFQPMRNKKEEKYPEALLNSRGENIFIFNINFTERKLIIFYFILFDYSFQRDIRH